MLLRPRHSLHFKLPHIASSYRQFSTGERSLRLSPWAKYAALQNTHARASRPWIHERHPCQPRLGSARSFASTSVQKSEPLSNAKEPGAAPENQSEPLLTPGTPTETESHESESRAEHAVPSYDMTFTCKPCKTRSTHRVSKQGYHHGTILITCPNCKNRHLISDNLKIFGDKKMTIDQFLEENGEAVQRGRLGPDGNIELWTKSTEALGKKFFRDPD